MQKIIIGKTIIDRYETGIFQPLTPFNVRVEIIASINVQLFRVHTSAIELRIVDKTVVINVKQSLNNVEQYSDIAYLASHPHGVNIKITHIEPNSGVILSGARLEAHSAIYDSSTVDIINHDLKFSFDTLTTFSTKDPLIKAMGI